MGNNPIMDDINRQGGMLPKKPEGTFEQEMARRVMHLNAQIVVLKNQNARFRRALEELAAEGHGTAIDALNSSIFDDEDGQLDDDASATRPG